MIYPSKADLLKSNVESLQVERSTFLTFAMLVFWVIKLHALLIRSGVLSFAKLSSSLLSYLAILSGVFPHHPTVNLNVITTS